MWGAVLAGLERLQRLHLRCMDFLYRKGFHRRFGACGPGTLIYYPCTVTGAAKIRVGCNVHINRHAFIRGEGGLVIGDNVHIARNLVVYTMNHNFQGDRLPYDHTHIYKPVTIGRNVWIGINVTIVPGVTIGEGAIIGAGTVVSSDVPDLAVVGSGPTRVLSYRDDEQYRRLDAEKRYGGRSGHILPTES